MLSLEDMTREHYGYGRWEAPYWFIGAEPGQQDKGRDDLEQRRTAWENLGGGELLGCAEHHFEMGITKYHRQHPPPAIQPTWGKLIRLLFAFSGDEVIDNDTIREYQRTQWGGKSGQTCVVELSSLAAKHQRVARDRKNFLEDRIHHLSRKMLECGSVFVVMYGWKQTPEFERLAGGTFALDGVRKIETSTGITVVLHIAAPTAHGMGNDMFDQFGKILAHHCGAVSANQASRRIVEQHSVVRL